MHGLIAVLFARSEMRERSLTYLQGLLSGCERKNGWQYVLAVASDQRLWQSYLMQHRVDAIAQSLPASRWERLSADFGSKGERLYDWASMELSKQDDWTRTLLVRRSIKEKPEYAYYLCYAPVGIDVFETLVRIAGERWQIEQCFQAAKPGSPRTGLGPWGGRANADWITTRCTIGGAGIDI